MNARGYIADHGADEPRDLLCWTRMQAEGGQALDKIVKRKEIERGAGQGLFFWGVGNAPGTLPLRLAAAGEFPEVVFSVMKTAPKPRDVSPASVIVWNAFIGPDGTTEPLPPHALVTSGAGPDGPTRRYALVCRSADPLRVEDQGPFDPSAYRNLGGAGRPVGASQVTALLRRVATEGSDPYRINMTARLAMGMWVRLADPARVETSHLAELDEVDRTTTYDEWMDLVARIRRSRRETMTTDRTQPSFDFARPNAHVPTRPAMAAN